MLLPAFNKVALSYEEADSPESIGLKSSLLNGIISSLPRLRQPMKELLGAVKLKKAAEGQKDSMWTDTEKYPEIIDADMVRGIRCKYPRILISLTGITSNRDGAQGRIESQYVYRCWVYSF